MILMLSMICEITYSTERFERISWADGNLKTCGMVIVLYMGILYAGIYFIYGYNWIICTPESPPQKKKKEKKKEKEKRIDKLLSDPTSIALCGFCEMVNNVSRTTP